MTFKRPDTPESITSQGSIVHEQLKDFTEKIRRATAAENAFVIVEQEYNDDDGTKWAHIVTAAANASEVDMMRVLADAYVGAVMQFVEDRAAASDMDKDAMWEMVAEIVAGGVQHELNLRMEQEAKNDKPAQAVH